MHFDDVASRLGCFCGVFQYLFSSLLYGDFMCIFYRLSVPSVL